ncbi:MAG: hypothetical protein HFI82_02590 [Eubacterium sp.]|jgi:hypothetical protein|nr:hypothetical protein [Eubacterium sp.]
MNQKIRKAAAFLAAAALFPVVCGCGEASGEDGYKVIADDYSKIILQRDLDSAEYDSALAAVGHYLNDPDKESLQSALSAVQHTARQMSEEAEQTKAYQMDEEFSELLQEYGIEPEEYLMNADERKQNLYDYISTLNTLDEYLTYEHENYVTGKALKKEYEMQIAIQKIMRSYDYCGINYWFAGWGEEETEYVKQKVHENLASFEAEDEAWQDTREAVEQRMEFYLNELEERMEEWAQYLGDYQEELYQMQSDLE